jgi:DNA integrity scanning protein DisA with diadenylate cyclase activity
MPDTFRLGTINPNKYRERREKLRTIIGHRAVQCRELIAVLKSPTSLENALLCNSQSTLIRERDSWKLVRIVLILDETRVRSTSPILTRLVLNTQLLKAIHRRNMDQQLAELLSCSYNP